MICRGLFPSLLSFITVNGIMITRCACGKCESMPTARESVCCQEIPEVEEKLRELDVQNTDCITDHEGFGSVCLDRWVLQTAASQMHQQYGRNSETNGPTHKFVVFALIRLAHEWLDLS